MADRERDSFKAAVESVIPMPALGYAHPSSVQTQDVDGRVSVDIDNGTPMAGASGVDVVYGLPLTVCKLRKGTRGRTCFDGGDPRKRVFTAFDSGTPCDEINIADATATQGAARNGDPCGVGQFSFVQTPPLPGPIPTGGTLFYTPQPTIEQPSPVPIPWLSFVGPIAITQLTPGPLPVTGNITGGSSVVKIGG